VSIADKLVYLNRTKILIRATIIGKGVAVPAQYIFRQLADKVAEIGGATDYNHTVTAPDGMSPKLAYLYKTKQLIKNAIQAKGVTPGDSFRGFVAKIAEIPGTGVITYYPGSGGNIFDPPLGGFYPVKE
jgi:acetyl-CoA carboxylase alpha subunit